VGIYLDLENVGIELLRNHRMYSTKNPSHIDLDEVSLAYMAFRKSKLIFESYSDSSKQIDLVSNEILMIDTRFNEKNRDKECTNVFLNILHNPKLNSSWQQSSEQEQENSEKLQFEVHYRLDNKNFERFSILINSCRVIVVFDWLIQVASFIFSNHPLQIQNKQNEVHTKNLILKQSQKHTEKQMNYNKFEIKLNFTNTDFVLIENLIDLSSQAVILRLTAYCQYTQRMLGKILCKPYVGFRLLTIFLLSLFCLSVFPYRTSLKFNLPSRSFFCLDLVQGLQISLNKIFPIITQTHESKTF
jgi:hypothetical protein